MAKLTKQCTFIWCFGAVILFDETRLCDEKGLDWVVSQSQGEIVNLGRH